MKQQAEVMDKFVEIEAMKHASESDKKEYIKMVTEHAMIMQRNCLLESKMREQELLKHLDSLNNTNTTTLKNTNDTYCDDNSENDADNEGVV